MSLAHAWCAVLTLFWTLPRPGPFVNTTPRQYFRHFKGKALVFIAPNSNLCE
jgi:hypothetical protein